ncbi:MAG: hypothetical protein HOY71_16895 [Nonomuraea sp.]|nr:hypothetical protein [Nonomuraea sp.]
MRRRGGAARSFAPPLDLRFIDLFMAIILALSFIAIMLTVVARMLPSESATTRQQTVSELREQLQQALAAQQQAQEQVRSLQGQVAEHVSFGLPWWLIGLCALLGVVALFMAWQVRLRRGGDLPKWWTWLVGTALVAAVTWWTRSNADSLGKLRLDDVSWWMIDAFCLGLLLVAYVLVSNVRESRRQLEELRSRPRPRAPRPPADVLVASSRAPAPEGDLLDP